MEWSVFVSAETLRPGAYARNLAYPGTDAKRTLGEGGIVCHQVNDDRRFTLLRQQRAKRVEKSQMLRLKR